MVSHSSHVMSTPTGVDVEEVGFRGFTNVHGNVETADRVGVAMELKHYRGGR